MFKVRPGSSVPTGGVIASNLQIANRTWSLHGGTAQTWHVFSFVNAQANDDPPYGGRFDITEFNADLNEFFREPY
jgi:hypothetical protein